MRKDLYTPIQALNNIQNNYFNRERSDTELERFWFDRIRQSLEALKIIKEKNVNIQLLKKYFFNYGDDLILKVYNQNHCKRERLTKEQFDLLKEVLENEQTRDF